MTNEVVQRRLRRFETRCGELGLVATHQRRIIYRVLAQSDRHPTPEAVYRGVKRHIPAISLATVYKNIKTFLRLGLIQERVPHAGSLRLDANLDRHHHLVCLRCCSVVDFYNPRWDTISAGVPRPGNYRILRYQVEAWGLCPACQKEPPGPGGKRRTHHGKSG